jgi:hypothetical protein
MDNEAKSPESEHDEDLDSNHDSSEISDEEMKRFQEFLDRGFGYVFAKSILEAPDDKTREELINTIVENTSLNKTRMEYLGVHVSYMQSQGETGIEIVAEWAQRLIKEYMHAHMRIERSGVSFSVYLEDELLSSHGHALNEGIVQYMTEQFTEKLLTEKPEFLGEIPDSIRDELPHPYKFETKMASELIKRVGEKTVLKAHFDGAGIEQLMESVDELYGSGSYMRLLELSDSGNWRDVFRLLSSVPVAEKKE